MPTTQAGPSSVKTNCTAMFSHLKFRGIAHSKIIFLDALAAHMQAAQRWVQVHPQYPLLVGPRQSKPPALSCTPRILVNTP